MTFLIKTKVKFIHSKRFTDLLDLLLKVIRQEILIEFFFE